MGSHILDRLMAGGIPTALLLRHSSPRSFIQEHLPEIEIVHGSVTEPASLPPALEGISHVIHCAGATKAVRTTDFHRINHEGTRNLVQAVNSAGPRIERFVHLSSLAAAGPALDHVPPSEATPPGPVSEYGRSKLAGELEVTKTCRSGFTVLRPPGVYGPRDTGFLSLFKAIRRHILPLASAAQRLSLVFVSDLADAVVRCLEHPGALGGIFYVASPEVVTARELAREIASRIGTWTLPVPVSPAVLWPVCLLQEVWARISNRPAMLSLAKFPELRAPAWICDPARLELETGIRCGTTLRDGIQQSLAWYRENRWL